ncbi:triose-phosphate isomerase [Thalassotalea maritima]|uniref:triose-phosphate isomerase n=1 Tax=Thalassotalea maritima TaxID=3242416 RepID=UPI0035294A5C
MSRQSIVAANWKMNGDTNLVKQMIEGLNDLQLSETKSVLICPPAPYLASLNHVIDNDHIVVGAQNISQHEKGAYTGELSALMLKDLQVQYVILGHSERRAMYGDTSELVAEKLATALEHGLTPILCVGETELERENGETEQTLQSQIQPVIEKVGIESFKNIVVAYEPRWAIGTGKTASAEIAQAAHQFIRGYLASFDADVANRVPVLYGGSVNAGNCKNLFSQPDIDGGLIGGASLIVEEFRKICEAV